MGFLITSILVIFALTCFFLIFLVMVQTGKGGSVGGMLSGGSSGSVFGASTADVMTKVTRGAGVTFIALALLLSFLFAKKDDVLIPEAGSKPSFEQTPGSMDNTDSESTKIPQGE
jgi:preprotein translocase subunit SecG